MTTNVAEYLKLPHWSTDIPLDTPHTRLDVLAEHGYVILRDLDPAGPRAGVPRRSSTWTGRAAATRTSRRSPPPTASSTAAASGSPVTSVPTRAGSGPPTRRSAPRWCARSRASAPTSGACARSSSSLRATRTRCASIHRDDNNRFNPDGEGWVVRQWIELTDFPDSFMILMEQGARRAPRPEHRGARPAAPGLAVRRRHATAVARRVPPRATRRATRSSPASRAVPRSTAFDRRQHGLRRQTSRLRSGSPRAPTPATRGAGRCAIPTRRRHRPGRTR